MGNTSDAPAAPSVPAIARRLDALVDQYHTLYGPPGYVPPGQSAPASDAPPPKDAPKDDNKKKEKKKKAKHNPAPLVYTIELTLPPPDESPASPPAPHQPRELPAPATVASPPPPEPPAPVASAPPPAPAPAPAPASAPTPAPAAAPAPQTRAIPVVIVSSSAWQAPPAAPPPAPAPAPAPAPEPKPMPSTVVMVDARPQVAKPPSKASSMRSQASSAPSKAPSKASASKVPSKAESVKTASTKVPSKGGSTRSLPDKAPPKAASVTSVSDKGSSKAGPAAGHVSTVAQEEAAVLPKTVSFAPPPESAVGSVLSYASVKRGPIRLVIFFDGTWQSRLDVEPINDQGTPTSRSDSYYTNVALLSQCLKSTSDMADANGYRMPQVSLYIDGVGATHDKVQKAHQGATGDGVNKNVEKAWAWLSDNWLPGDEIFIFGFSRGAFTARALAGLIHWGGILTKRQAAFLKPVWDAYVQRRPDKHDTGVHAAKTLRAVTGLWPNPQALGVAHASSMIQLGDACSKRDRKKFDPLRVQVPPLHPAVRPPSIKVVGVWDTVGALGFPGQFQNPLVKEHYAFFDPGLGRNIQYAFHALALDEERKDFLPTMFYQPRDAPPDQVLRQTWFQGSHTDVGGGYQDHGLSDITLAWMVAHLRDPKEGPLLNIDVRRLRKLQDERIQWARQPPHRSRMAMEARAVRQVDHCHRSLLDVVGPQWADMVSYGRRYESLHHSVVVGQRHTPRDSEQFDSLRRNDPGKLVDMWHEATDPATLLPSEQYFRWSGGDRPPKEKKKCKLVSSQYEPTHTPKKSSRRTVSLNVPPKQAAFYSVSTASGEQHGDSSHRRRQSETAVAAPPPAPREEVYSPPPQTSRKHTFFRSLRHGPTGAPPFSASRAAADSPRPAPAPARAATDRSSSVHAGSKAASGHSAPPAPAATGVPPPIDELEPGAAHARAASILSSRSTQTLEPTSSVSTASSHTVRTHSAQAPAPTTPSKGESWTITVPKPSWSVRRKDKSATAV